MDDQQYEKETIYTDRELRTIAHSKTMRDISKLSLPEIDGLVERIARIAPAGNIPGVILNGLASLKQKQPSEEIVRRDIGLLFRGVEQSLKDHAVYTTFFAGPAAVIYAYQTLLKLAGKNPDAAFDYGTWDFYVKYALRDDTARHTCETHGFGTTLRQHAIQLSEIDKLTAWVTTAVHCLHQYDALLENEWRERVQTHLLAVHVPAQANLYSQWERQRPFARGHDADPKEDYPTYRRRQFDKFMTAAMLDLPDATVRAWQADVKAATAASLRHYQRQMTIRAYLKPNKYNEERQLFKEDEAFCVGIIHDGRYYLLKACQDDDHTQPVSVQTIRQQIATIFNHPALNTPQSLTGCAHVKRSDWYTISQKLACLEEIDGLHVAPIWINTDLQSRNLPLAQMRQVERAVGDQPLTIFFTPETAVFDLSHIFFDGAWGVSLAEILTNEATAWAAYLHTLPPAQPGNLRPYSPSLELSAQRGKTHPKSASRWPQKSVQRQRPLICQPSLNYANSSNNAATCSSSPSTTCSCSTAPSTPSPTIPTSISSPNCKVYSSKTPPATPPPPPSPPSTAIQIPPSSSPSMPAATIPATVSSRWLSPCRSANSTCSTPTNNCSNCSPPTIPTPKMLKREYLGNLAGFGEVLSRAKEVANAGESASVGSIKLLAHMPAASATTARHHPQPFRRAQRHDQRARGLLQCRSSRAQQFAHPLHHRQRR